MTELMSDWAAPIHRQGTTGEAAVLIHGFTGHPGHWHPLAEVLSERGHTVIAPRLAGHGTSPVDLGSTGADDWVASARTAAGTVADHRRIHLVGLSMGGMVAILLARPTAAATITTINAPVRVSDRRALLAPYFHRLVPSTQAGADSVPDPDLAHLWSPYAAYPTVAVAGLVAIVRSGWRAAGRVRRPSLVIQSRADTIVRPVSGPRLAKRLGADLLWLDTARHNAILDPERTLIHEAVVSMVERS